VGEGEEVVASLKFRRKRKDDVPAQPPPSKEAQEAVDALVNHYRPGMKHHIIWREQGSGGAGKPARASEPSDPRIREFLNEVGLLTGRPLQHYAITDYHVLRDKNGAAYAYISPQRERLRVEVGRDRVEQAAIRDWEEVTPKGWSNEVDVAYFSIPNADENAMKHIADTLARLWAASPR